MEEVWKDIPSRVGYQASNLGNIRSLDRVIEYNSRGVAVKSLKRGRQLIPQRYPNGYRYIAFKNGGNRTTQLIHRLVLEAFVGKSDLVVDHLNGVRHDNRLENLEYVTQRANTHRARVNKTSKYKGICFASIPQKWKAGFSLGGKNIHVGYFDCEEEAYRELKAATLSAGIDLF